MAAQQKPVGSTEKLANEVNRAFAMPVPAFSDMGKAANDVRNPPRTARAHKETGGCRC